MKSLLAKVAILLLGVFILYISLTRAGLEKLIRDERRNDLRKVPIIFQHSNQDNFIEEGSYKFPETSTLPNSPFYFLKKIRDELWIIFTGNSEDKVRVLMLVADKRMEEARLLNEKEGNEWLIIKTVEDSIQKMTKAKEIVESDRMNEVERNQFRQRQKQEFMAYKWVIDWLKIDSSNKEILFDKLTKSNEK